jgi:hypothetical protein
LKVETFIRQRELRNQMAERAFVLRMRRALRLTVEPIYEQLQYTTNLNVDALKGDHIHDALKWLYVIWGYQQQVWFSRNFEFQKKDAIWLNNLESWFNLYGADKVTAILGTTKDLIKPMLKDALLWAADGLSIQDITKALKTNIEKEGGAISIGRCRTIARTEVISASNTASHQAVNAVTAGGANIEKAWITGGINVRETHTNAEAQGWIPFDQPFIVGSYEMQHPGDDAGGAEEVINCKCTLIYRTID